MTIKKKPEAPQAAVTIPKLEIDEIVVRVTGLSPLLAHNWAEKAKTEIRDKQGGKKIARERAIRDPRQEFQDARYIMPDGRDGFPAIAFKLAMKRAAKGLDGLTMVDLSTWVYVLSDVGQRQTGLVAIEADEPEMREDMVRVSNGAVDLRYRPAYFPWAANLRIRFQSGKINRESVVALVARAGLTGVGDWRPEKNGDFGTWTVGE